MRPFVTAGTGFLLAVLWFDLMFDVQVRGHRGADLPEAVLDSIATYYRRVTTAARPMNRLVAVVMLATLTALVVQIVRGNTSRIAGTVSLLLTGSAIALAAARTVRNAVRLGGRGDSSAVQSTLARSILSDHVCCVLAILAALVTELVTR